MASPKAARQVIAAFGDVEVTELENCGHMLLAEQPDRVLEAMLESAGRNLSRAKI
jgi:pimeloyl-ACP methyl ester carboxylesterase